MDDNNGFTSNLGSMNGYNKPNDDGIFHSGHRDQTANVQYSMPGILHYLQTEWAKMEIQRSQWDIEKAELQARIAFLQGERKGQETLKQDLVRRIKMLEYALKQERVKYHQLKSKYSNPPSTTPGSAETGDVSGTTTDQVDSQSSGPALPGDPSLEPSEKLASDARRAVEANVKWRESRQKLRQFLQEVGFTETILDVRQARVKQLIDGMGGDNQVSRMLASTFSDGGASSVIAAPSSGGLANVTKGPGDSNLVTLPSTGGSGMRPGGGPGSGTSRVGFNGGGGKKQPSALEMAQRRFGGSGGENEDDSDDKEECIDDETDALANFDFLGSADDDEGGSMDMMDRDLGMRGQSGGGKRGPVNALDDINEPFLDNFDNDRDMGGGKGMRFGRKMGQRSSLKGMLASLEDDCRDMTSMEMMSGGQSDTTDSGMGNIDGVSVGGPGGPQGSVAPHGVSADELEGFGGALGLGDLATLTVANEAEASANKRIGGDVLKGSMQDHVDSLDIGLSSTSLDMKEEENDGQRKSWCPKYTLRGHMDAIRSLVFHPTERALFTASEDSTINIWNLNKTALTKKCVSVEVDPIHTLRGHCGPVLCLANSSLDAGENLYSGGMDGTIRVWRVPSLSVDIYDAYDSVENGPILRGHTDAVWSLSMHPSRPSLLSASSDGTLRLWDMANLDVVTPQLQTAPSPCLKSTLTLATLLTASSMPTCVQFSPSDPGHCAVGCSDGRVALIDLEMSKVVCQDMHNPDGTSAVSSSMQANCLGMHPALPLIVTGHDDTSIRFLDINQGKTVHSMVAHLDAVTGLALDSYGLYVATGSHDCSIRLWNMDNKTCVQEWTSHRKKFDESVHCIAFHPKMPFMASGGADAVAKVFV